MKVETTVERAKMVRNNGYISLKEACKYFPGRTGEPLCLAAMYRWTTKGCRGVKLRTAQLGAVRCTREEWIEDFFEKLTEKAGTRDPMPTPSSRQQEVERELDAIGI
jgi:hypothetical protein